MRVGKNSKWVIALLPLLIVMAADAAPTLNSTNAARPAVSRTSQVDSHTVLERVEITIYSDSHLAAVGAEFLKPPSVSSALTASPAIHTKTLPAVPRALLLVLTGFLYVSLVKDRKVWLAAFAGLLWAGQTGIQAIPQLAVRLSHKNYSEQKLCAEFTYPHHFAISDRPRSDIEGTQYIGLLHHLAGIPRGISALRITQAGGAEQLTAQHKLSQRVSDRSRRNTVPFLSAIIQKQCSLNSLLNCLVFRARRFVCFSPAFIFDIIPRGPPKLA